MSDFLIGFLAGSFIGFLSTLVAVVLVDWYELRRFHYREDPFEDDIHSKR
jgi:purine-cytosine permease-like protein